MSRISVQLNPQNLGHVTIMVEKPLDGGAKISLTATRPETLALLQQGTAQLGQLLDRAGVASEGRSMMFHLAPSAIVTAEVASANTTGQHGGSGSGATDGRPQTDISLANSGSLGNGEAGRQHQSQARPDWVSGTYALVVPSVDEPVPNQGLAMSGEAASLNQIINITA